MKLQKDNIILRPYALSDAPALAVIANNRDISKNLRDGFPFPYGLEDAQRFIKMCLEKEIQSIFAIFYKGDLAGSIGLHPQEDIYRLTAEIGYFIAEKYWNKGIATKSVGMITEFGFESLHLTRIYAGIFETNKASMKILEKNGYVLECIKRKAIFKNQHVLDEYLYAKVND